MEPGEMTKQSIELLSGEERLSLVSPLFDAWDETMIWSALQGVMGQVWAAWEPQRSVPVAALCLIGDLAFLAGAGDSAAAQALTAHMKVRLNGRCAIVVPRDGTWHDALMAAIPDAKKAERYAFFKDVGSFDRQHLQALCASIALGICLKPIDGVLYDRVMAESWCRDFCSCFASKQDYLTNGLGVVAMREGEIIGGASSYTYFRGGIEIQVDTREDVRRQGIAAACSARLILNCLDRELYPSWDAASRASVALALKLGYKEKGAYPVWEVNGE